MTQNEDHQEEVLKLREREGDPMLYCIKNKKGKKDLNYADSQSGNRAKKGVHYLKFVTTRVHG